MAAVYCWVGQSLNFLKKKAPSEFRQTVFEVFLLNSVALFFNVNNLKACFQGINTQKCIHSNIKKSGRKLLQVENLSKI